MFGQVLINETPGVLPHGFISKTKKEEAAKGLSQPLDGEKGKGYNRGNSLRICMPFHDIVLPLKILREKISKANTLIFKV